jgi:hypothetical protein
MSAHSYSTRINQAMQPIVALKAQMGAVSRMGMDPVQRREWLNNQTRIIADRYKLVDSYITDMNATMSRFAGKPIKFGDIKWGKGTAVPELTELAEHLVTKPTCEEQVRATEVFDGPALATVRWTDEALNCTKLVHDLK